MAMIGLFLRDRHRHSHQGHVVVPSACFYFFLVRSWKQHYQILPLVLLLFLWDSSACPGLGSQFMVISQAPDWSCRH